MDENADTDRGENDDCELFDFKFIGALNIRDCIL